MGCCELYASRVEAFVHFFRFQVTTHARNALLLPPPLLMYRFQGAGVDRTDTGAYLRVDLQWFGVSSTNPHWFSTEQRFLDPQVTVLYRWDYALVSPFW